jgi:hypothetical protein
MDRVNARTRSDELDGETILAPNMIVINISMIVSQKALLKDTLAIIILVVRDVKLNPFNDCIPPCYNQH